MESNPSVRVELSVIKPGLTYVKLTDVRFRELQVIDSRMLLQIKHRLEYGGSPDFLAKLTR
jgi:hypothetical protein